MADPFVGEIRAFGFSYAPQDWAHCDGSKIAIQQYQALYAVIGNLYGGDLKTYFNLPNLQSRAVPGAGDGPGLTSAPVAETGGVETTPLTSAQLAAHQHNISNTYPTVTSLTTYLNTPVAGATLARTVNQYDWCKAPQTIDPWGSGPSLNPATIGPALGNGAPPPLAHENRQPYLALNFCICLIGEFPMRPS